MMGLLKQEILLCVAIFVLPGAVEVKAGVPLKYYSHMIAQVEATVVDISTAKLREDGKTAAVQKITLKIDSVIKYKLAGIYPGKPYFSFQLTEGMSVDLSNPWLDQQTPFKKGAVIKAYIKLVSAEQVYNPDGKHNKWWFAPAGDFPGGNTPPRKPFTNIELVSGTKNK